MVALAWWLYLAVAPLQVRVSRGPALGWARVGAAFAAVAAIVVWPPSLILGLAVQIAATVVLAVGVGVIYRSAAR
jgi:hypothetical protein